MGFYNDEMIELAQRRINQKIIADEGHNKFDDYDDHTKGQIIGIGLFVAELSKIKNNKV